MGRSFATGTTSSSSLGNITMRQCFHNLGKSPLRSLLLRAAATSSQYCAGRCETSSAVQPSGPAEARAPDLACCMNEFLSAESRVVVKAWLSCRAFSRSRQLQKSRTFKLPMPDLFPETGDEGNGVRSAIIISDSRWEQHAPLLEPVRRGSSPFPHTLPPPLSEGSGFSLFSHSDASLLGLLQGRLKREVLRNDLRP